MTNGEREFLKYILAFFAVADGIVCDNLTLNVTNRIKLPEAKYFFNFQCAMENIHAEVYAALIRTYIENDVEKRRLFQAIETMPVVKRKAEWALKWLNDGKVTFAERLVAFAVIEGVFFSGSFAAIYWIRSRGLMPGLTFSNELIARDEAMHCEFACALLNNHIKHRPSPARVKAIVSEAVDIELEFFKAALPTPLLNMNARQMCTYVQFAADCLLDSMNYDAQFHVKNPFPFMESISLQGKTNFFEKRVSEYSKIAAAPRTAEANLDASLSFQLDDEF